MTTVIAALVSAHDAHRRCVAQGNQQWADRWSSRVEHLMESAPSGAGFDNGTTLDVDGDGEPRLSATSARFVTSFHHMRDGMYTRWTDHTVTVTAEFGGINVRVGGRNHKDIKDYIGEVFHAWLTSEAPFPRW